MNIINKSRKIIAINGEAFLPGTSMEIDEGMEQHPSIKKYLKEGVVVDENSATALSSSGVSDEERSKIAQEAVEKYKAEQEAKAALEAEIKAVETMKKADLVTKALAMGIEVADSDTADMLKDKIIAALSE